MKKNISVFIIIFLILGIVVTTGCAGSKSTKPVQSSSSNSNTTISQTSDASGGSGLLRNENWLLGTWSATVPKSNTSQFAGKKIDLKISNVMLIDNEKIQGRPQAKYAYSGNLVWDAGGEDKILVFVKEDWATGDGSLIWEYASPGANQFMENITMRIYDLTFAFELDWGPQISKPGSTIKSLGFFGSIQNLGTSDKDIFDPDNPIKFSQTSTTAPNIASPNSVTTSAGSSPTKTSKTIETSSPSQTTSTGLGTGDIWNDIPVYPDAKKAEDEGFEMSVGGDESYSQIEWHYLATTDEIVKVTDFYTKQMPAKGWKKMMWADVGEMSYGSYQKNNETRMCAIYLVKSEGGTAINIMSSAK
jgi:hypothetical protein